LGSVRVVYDIHYFLASDDVISRVIQIAIHANYRDPEIAYSIRIGHGQWIRQNDERHVGSRNYSSLFGESYKK
jgi:hypothetical protein